MNKIIIAVLATTLLTACSKSGSKGMNSGDEDMMGGGNVPIAQPGSELSDVRFDYDSADLSIEANAELKESSQYLLDNPNKSVVVEGHCDERGTTEYNLALGDKRAKSTYDYLTTLGVKKDKMSTISYGKEVPLDPASTESAWAKNRRVHFSIKK